MRQPTWIHRTLGAILIFSAGVLTWTLAGGKERVLAKGTFHSVAHKGRGEARIVEVVGQGRILRLLDFQTYPAPDLQVCLFAAPDAEDNEVVHQSAPVCLGNVDPRMAYHAYPVPAALDLNRYRAVAIWSRDYQVNFTTAPLW